MEDHLTWDEQLEKGNDRVMPCICFKAGYDGTLDIQDVIHPNEYKDGELSRYQAHAHIAIYAYNAIYTYAS